MSTHTARNTCESLVWALDLVEQANRFRYFLPLDTSFFFLDRFLAMQMNMYNIRDCRESTNLLLDQSDLLM